MQTDASKSNGTNAVIFELKDDVLLVCNNGDSFSIEGIESLMLPCYTSKSEREFNQSFKSENINEQVQELLDERRQEYMNSPKRIQSDYNSEHNTVGEYHGREILELIQNCIDAMPGESNFQIGAKGLGFRSLLNWCDRIEIYSGDLSVAFGLEEARRFRESLGLKQKIAILSAPTVIEPIALDYTTQIYLHLKKSVVGDVKAQLMQIDERSIVFLPKIEELIIRDDDNERTYLKLDDANGDVLVSAMVDGTSSEYLWRVFKQERNTVVFDDIDNEQKAFSYEIAVAFCENIQLLNDNYLYSYFKTKVEFPLGWLCHADFELSTDRNTITNHPLNKLILGEMVALIDASSEKITEYISNPEKALRSIAPFASLPNDIAGFKFAEYYHANIGRKKVFPTTNGSFISIYDSPLIAKGILPVLFNGEAFNRFVKLKENIELLPFVKKIATRENVSTEITAQIIQNAINSVSSKWSSNDCLTVFEWWRKNFGIAVNAIEHLPNLIKLENGKWASGNDRVYFKVGRVPDVPHWVRFTFLSKDFQDAAMQFYSDIESYIEHKSLSVEQRDERIISDYVSVGGMTFFRYLDRNTTIAQVNISVGDNWDYACEFLAWLYKNYGNAESWTPPAEVGFNFPSQNKNVVRPERLYFGEHYGNNLAAILALQEEQEELFHVPMLLEDKNQFIFFITKFGVRHLPARELVSFREWSVPKVYKDALFSHFEYPYTLDWDTTFRNEAEMRDTAKILLVSVEAYKNLDTILASAKTMDLLLWIAQDDFLKNSIMSTYEKNSLSVIKAIRNGQRRDGRSIPRTQIRNFIAHTFQYAKWVSIGDKRYSPVQIILDEKIGTQLEPHLIGKSIDYLFEGLLIEEYEINAIADNLGFINDFSKIESSILYKLLNELSKDGVDDKGELSRKIYLQIMKASGLKEPDTSCTERQRFLQSGKVYCFDGRFHKVNQVRYADKSFPERVQTSQRLIYLPKNRGAIKAEKWFGTKEFKPGVTVHSFIESVHNPLFQRAFREMLKGLYVENRQDITDEKRWRAVKNMRIILASSVVLSFDKIEQPSVNYEYATNNAGHYVLMIGSAKPNPFDERFASALFEIVKSTINIENLALGVSFRELLKFPSDELRDALKLRNEDEHIWHDADLFFDGVVAVPQEDTVAENRKLFAKCRNDNFEKFRRILYAKLFTANIDMQKTYLIEIEKYKNIEPADEELQENPCNVLALLLSFPPANLLDEDDVIIDVNEEGKRTRQRLYEAFPLNIEELNVFLSREYDSLLRFGNYEMLETAFTEHLSAKDKNDTAGEIPARNKKQPIIIDTSDGRLAHTKLINRKKGSPQGGNGYVDYSSRQAQNVNVGKLSEKIVHEYLTEEHGNSDVKWVSQFAREENVNLDGADGAGYDIEYSKEGVKYFVEVKTNSSNLPTISFNLTSAERAFAELHDEYQIFIVTAPKSDTPTITPFSWIDIQAFSNTPTGFWVEFTHQDNIDLDEE